MKKYILALFCLMPVITFSQTQKDYEDVMNKFKQYYNKNQVDSICYQYSDIWADQKMKLWTKASIKENKSRYGTINSVKYAGIDSVSDNNKVALFVTKTTKKKFITGVVLDNKNKIETFRFHTSSPYIDSVLSKN